VTVSLVASKANAYELPSWRGRARVEPPASLWEAFDRGGAVLTIGDRSGDIVIDSPGEVWSELTGSGDPPF
jgi:hypothetical protein